MFDSSNFLINTITHQLLSLTGILKKHSERVTEKSMPLDWQSLWNMQTQTSRAIQM